ncbi:MAG TPA: uracil-DNA glycosylase, partial [Candidatus Manganitrophaceae bacterium]|nr:uracil-DNA glycosylase [Candidatus Manganitrophaceae bacterium]
PFLLKQIQAIRPKIICALGTFSAQTLLSTQRRISDLRGKFHDFDLREMVGGRNGNHDLRGMVSGAAETHNGIKVLPTFHPAYLLRNPNEKKRVWEDLQKIMEELKQGAGSRG